LGGVVTVIAVKAEDLVRRFGDFTAVDRVSFEVSEGSIFGFLGPNGAGKTTTIRMLCGLLAPSEGHATVAGFDVSREPDKIKESIGYMSQKFSLYADLTVKQNLDFYAGVYSIPRKKRAARIDLALRIAGLQGLEHRLTGTLAGGVKQRLALGAAILHEPRIVFLDEPTAGVDPASRRDFWDLIAELRRQGVTVFVTTHYMDEAEHCDSLILIYSGRKIAEASPRELVTDVIEGTMLEVSGPAPREVVERLAASNQVKRAQIFGLTSRVLIQDGSTAVDRLKGLLSDAGWPEAQVRPIRASLEDAFMHLIELEDERIAAQGGRTR
jgi:ABC-2 type transport system ATP-binding protein